MYILAHMPNNDIYLGMELFIEMFTCFCNFYISLPLYYTVCYTVCVND